MRLRGRASTAVMRLTPYNPTASYYELQNVGVGPLAYNGHITRAYPGYAAAQDYQAVNSRTRLSLMCAFQADPAGLTLTRESTGTTHLIAAGWVNTAPGTVILAQPLESPLQQGEVFKLPLVCRSSVTTRQVASNVRFGGFNDIGSAFEQLFGTSITVGNNKAVEYPILFPAVMIGTPVAIEAKSRYHRAGQKVRIASVGAQHTDIAAATDYWITRVDFSIVNAPRLYISPLRNGPEVVYSGTPPVEAHKMAQIPQSVGTTMAGMQVRFTSGAMNGQAFALDDNVLVANTPTDDFNLQTIEIMPSVPQAADTFVVEPQPINGDDVPWDEFAYFTPECSMDGQSYGQITPVAANYPTTAPGTPVTLTFPVGHVYEGLRFRAFDYYNVAALTTTTAPISGGLLGVGQVLYAVNVNYATGACNVSATYGGAPISNATLTASVVGVAHDEHPDRGNPMPPGWNFDNANSVPYVYQPYFGAEPTLYTGDKGATFTTSLGLAMHQRLGQSVYVIHTNVGGSSLARRETTTADLLTVNAAAHSWFDPSVMLDWTPNAEVEGCYARTAKSLVMAKRAALAAGHTLKIVGVFFPQGESDILFAGMLDRYAANIRALIAATRALIVELGLWDGPASSIPWWQPHVPLTVGNDWGGDGYASNAVFNDILDDLADEDPYFVTRPVDDATVGYDQVHYSGDYQFTLGLHAFADWDAVAQDVGDRTQVDICNQALKNVGESRVIESLTETTAAASICRRYYPVAVRTLLEAFPWEFASKTKTLTAVANPREALDWAYAYRLPSNFLAVVGIGPDIAAVLDVVDVEHTVLGNVLYCNLSEVTLRYSTIAPDPARYTQHFTNALAHQLASEIAPALAQGDKGAALAQSQMQLARYFIDQAREHSAVRLRHANPTPTKYAWD
jgi:hypothetical protein